VAKGTFDDNSYDLPGLDDEAATTLADRILERNNATKYREDEKENQNLRKLIKVLDGFPLAMEVVLANLRQQTPGELLEELQAGDVRLDIPASQQQGKSLFEQKTESILRCIDYSHSNLSPDAQHLLLCLAPFTSVTWTDMLDQYTHYLKQQPALSALPFERWQEVIREAQDWGLLSPHDVPAFQRLQPIFPYFLRNRLHEPEQADVRKAIETAFREHYVQLGNGLMKLLLSRNPQERIVGRTLTDLEYENLVTALNLALVAQISIYSLYGALTNYLDTTQDQHRGFELGQTVLARLEAYSVDKLSGELGIELSRLIGDIANRQIGLKRHKEAEAAYQKLLKLVSQLKYIDEKERGELKANTYHNLGAVAQEQREFQQAEQYYQQALQLKIEYNDCYEQAGTYHNLGSVAMEQRAFQQARNFFLHALEIYVAAEDNYHLSIVLRSVARLWQASGDVHLPTIIAPLMNTTSTEAEEILRNMLEKKPDTPKREHLTEG